MLRDKVTKNIDKIKADFYTKVSRVKKKELLQIVEAIRKFFLEFIKYKNKN